MSASKQWRCSVCGYVHSGDLPPDFCPVCGADKAEFEKYSAPAAEASPAKPSKWRCLNCNYFHEGAEPPEFCPVCGAEKDKFEAVEVERSVSATATTINAVIIGGGVAGVSAAESIRKASADSRITLLCTESELPYYRLNLTRYLAGEITRDSLPLHPESWFSENGIELQRGVSVEKISTSEKAVFLVGGRSMPYDKLILATGSHPYVPPLDGVSLGNVFTLRTSQDADKILQMALDGAKIVGIGGGILGLETAAALAARGADVTILESHGWLMPRQLNRRGAEVLERHMAKIGIRLLKEAKTKAIVGTESVSAVELQDGRSVPADLVVLATGVRPNTSLARKAGMEVDKGIIVDNHLRTSQPDIFAAGDAAEHNGQVYGSWAASQFQGGIAGLNALGIATQFGGLPRANTVKALGLDLTSIGKFTPDDGSYVVMEEEEDVSYIEFVFCDSKMVGAILIGHAELAVKAKNAVESGRDFSAILKASPSCEDISVEIGG